MDKELKTKWLAALRGGSYKQGKFYLKNSDSFCCLGVLCEIQGADFDAIRETYGTLSMADSPQEYLGCVEGPLRNTLSSMNDNGASFAEIADYIDSNI